MEPLSAEPAERRQRAIVSYVRRSTRMRPAQRGWLECYAERWLIPVAPAKLKTSVAPQPTLDFTRVFGREAPLAVEIGSGHGDGLVSLAAADPETDFLGFEVFEPGLASTLGKIAQANLSNVRLIGADAVGGLTHLIGDQRLREILIFFPDPWQKKRHQKRRLVSRAFADLVAAKLAPDGLVRLATDWESYAELIEAVFNADRRFELVSRERPPERAVTKFEGRAISAGRKIEEYTYRRVGSR